ncbi:hypothetical protein EXX81_21935, partial [Escherichia coli]
MRLVTMKPTSVIIMDTHPIIRMSIEVLLQKNSELQIVRKRAARTVLTGMCYSVGSATRQGSS